MTSEIEQEQQINDALLAFDEKKHELTLFMEGVAKWFAAHPKLAVATSPVIHSVKMRLKDRGHLREKLIRKWDDASIDTNNLFNQITDLAGVRVLHIHQEQFSLIHKEILDKVENLKDWHLPEPPKAYTWDPESLEFFKNLDIEVNVKESFYTSVHYLVRPRSLSDLPNVILIRWFPLFEGTLP